MNNLKFAIILIFSTAFICCDKEVEIEPSNIYGTWEHYFPLSSNYWGMRFHKDGNFEFLKKDTRDDWKKDNRYENFERFTFEMNDKEVKIYGHYDSLGFPTPTELKVFTVTYLSKKKMIENTGTEGEFEWKRE